MKTDPSVEQGDPSCHGEPADAIAEWLMQQALGDPDLSALFTECCERLRASGVAIDRAHASFRTLHPLYEAVALTWRSNSRTQSLDLPHRKPETNLRWTQSPLYHLIENHLPGLRRRLVGPEAVIDFPFLEELRADGQTDYLAYLIAFDPGYRNGVVGSWSSHRSSGFTAGEVRILERIQKRLAVACKIKIKDQIAENVVTAYLGRETGSQVLDGSIKRGDGEALRAAIWYSDLRASTQLAETLPVDEFLAVLNRYFDCTAGAVRDQGGEVVALIGDAVLAIFRCAATSETATCQAALAAARLAEARLTETNRERLDAGHSALDFGVGLHLGTVIHGNIGIPDRLAYTIVGPAVNETVRIEALTKRLHRRVLASRAFAEQLEANWEALGPQSLKGFPGAHQIFAPES